MLITPEEWAIGISPFGVFHTSLGSALCTEAELKSELSVGSVPWSALLHFATVQLLHAEFLLKFSIRNILGIEEYRSSNEAPLSPVQCVVNLPEPANVERDKTNGRFLRIVVIALDVKPFLLYLKILQKAILTCLMLVIQSNQTYYVDYNVAISTVVQMGIMF